MHRLIDELGISRVQRIEAASYSMAMVVRYALGLSATGGKVTALVGDSLAGGVALATLRHLVNAGAEGCVLCLSPIAELSPVLREQLAPLERMNVSITHCTDAAPGSSTHTTIESSHNVIVGLFEASETNALLGPLVTLLNELHTPAHAIEAPLGVDPGTGAAATPLFASSTLSLGAPLVGLSAGGEYVGRHYLCDISATADIYRQSATANLTSLFAEQPIVQIAPFTQNTQSA